MIFPLLSVSLIGLVVALRMAPGWIPQSRALRHGLIGGWAGYVVGAIIGFLVSFVLPTDIWIGLIGHGAAFVGARASVLGDEVPVIERRLRNRAPGN
jgi:hypothetical protein